MEAQAWTAIGLLAATLIGALFYLGNRIDSLGARLDTRIDSLGSDIRDQSSRIDGLSAGLGSDIRDQSSRIDGLSARMDALAIRVEEQGTQLGDRIYDLALKLDDHLRRHAS